MASFTDRVQRHASEWLLHARKALYQRSAYQPGNARAGFILGVQRSGTNMLVDAVDASFQTKFYNEDHPAAFDNFRIRPADVQRQLVSAAPCDWVFFKPICDLQNTDIMLTDNAGSKAVWIYRRYADVANSALNVEKWGADRQIDHIRRMATEDPCTYWFCERATDAMRGLAQKFYERGLSQHEGGALKWYFRNLWYFELALQNQPDRVLLVNYENLVTRPVEVTKQMFDFFGMTFDPAFVAHVSPQSIGKSKFPDIDPDIRALCDDLNARLDGAAQRFITA